MIEIERREIHISAVMTDERVAELLASAKHDDVVVIDRLSYNRGRARNVPSGVSVRVLPNYSPAD